MTAIKVISSITRLKFRQTIVQQVSCVGTNNENNLVNTDVNVIQTWSHTIRFRLTMTRTRVSKKLSSVSEQNGKLMQNISINQVESVL
jgi:acetylglutamate synthase